VAAVPPPPAAAGAGSGMLFSGPRGTRGADCTHAS